MCWQGGIFYSQRHLLSLPTELLHEICKYLGPSGILILRRVCRLLQRVTRSKIVWLSFATTLESQLDIARADEPLSSYTAEELEDWVIRRSWITRSPRYETGLDPPHRTAQVKPGRDKRLLPGGRWLLCARQVDSEFILSYIDLDSEALETIVLLTIARSEGVYDPVNRFDFWIVPEAPTLTLRVVLWNSCFVEPSPPRSGRTRVMVYTVSLIGHGSAAKLIAEPFRFFHGRFPGAVWRVALDKTRFIQLKYPEFGFRRCYFPGVSFQMQVLKYTQPDLDSVEPITVQFTFTDVPVLAMEVLPCDRVALMSQRSITIFPIPDAKDTGSVSWAPSHVLDLENYPMKYGKFRSFHDHGFSIIVCSGISHIIAVRIVHQNLEESRIVPLAPQNPGSLPLSVAGLSRAILGPGCSFNQLRLVDYDWDMASTEQSHIHVTESITEVPYVYRSNLIAYSEDTGRLVLYTRRNYTMHVYDPLL